MVLSPTALWTGNEGALMARPFLVVPTADAGWLGVDVETGMPFEVSLLAVMLDPPLEVRGLCLSTPLWM